MSPVWVGLGDCGCPTAFVLAEGFDPAYPSEAERQTLAASRSVVVWVLLPGIPAGLATTHRGICRRTEPVGYDPVSAVIVPAPLTCSPSCSEGHTYEPPCELADEDLARQVAAQVSAEVAREQTIDVDVPVLKVGVIETRAGDRFELAETDSGRGLIIRHIAGLGGDLGGARRLEAMPAFDGAAIVVPSYQQEESTS